MKKDNYLKINDLVTFSFLNPELVRVKDDFDNKKGVFSDSLSVDAQEGNGLKVRIAATHAGVVTRNNMFYLPDKLKKGAATFTKDYNKPVLLHHDEHRDPIGRVIDSFYIDTSRFIKDNYTDVTIKDSSGHELNVTDKVLQNFCDGTMPFGMQVELIRNLFSQPVKDGRSPLDNKSYEGLGHVQIIADITDADAVQKFLDGRYLTGSVGATTDKAICSICKQDWIGDAGPCEHEPGNVYDDMKMILIAGDFFYDEYSVANTPADRHSKVLELYYNGNVKNIEIKNEYAGDVHEICLEFPQYDSISEEESRSMSKKKEVEKVQDSVEGKKPLEVEEDVKDDISPEGKKNEEEKPESVEDFFDRLATVEKVTVEDADKLYDLSWEGMDDKVVEDFKLSPEQRVKLAKSSFCSPEDRTFPVNDEVHYRIALKLLDLYKGPGDKEKIKKSIDRKAKAKGWVKKVKKSKDGLEHALMLHMVTNVMEENMWTKSYLERDGKEPILAEEEVKSLGAILKRLAGMVGKDNFAKAISVEDGQELKDVVKVFQDVDLLEEIISLEDVLGNVRDEFEESKDTRDALREEYDLLQGEVDSLRDELIDEKKKLRDAKIDKLDFFVSLKDGVPKEDEDRVATFQELTDEAVDAKLEELTNEVDINKIADKLSDGMSRTPEGSVEDPTAGSNIHKKILDGDILQKKFEQMQSTYLSLSFKSKAKAERWLNSQLVDMVNKGELPEEIVKEIKENILTANV